MRFLDRVEDKLFNKQAAQIIGWIMFVGGIIAWPSTALTIFKGEQQGILGLSFIAIIYGGFQVLQQTYTNKMVVDKDNDGQ